MASIDGNEKTRLMRDGTIHAVGLALSSVAGLILVPLMVHGLGIEGYGLWASAMAAVGIFGSLDLGLRLIIVRDLAGDPHSAYAPAVRMMLWVHFAIGIVAALLILLGGLILPGKFHLSPGSARIVPLVFAIAGISCFFDQLFAYVMSVMAGLRRFDLLNASSVAISLLRLGLFAAALALGKGILAIVSLQAFVSVLSGIAGLLFVSLAAPKLRPRWESLRWQVLREPLGFGALSQAATSISTLQMPISTLLISVINGAAAVTPFTVGQKFPGLVSGLTWRTSEVFFPVASRQRHRAEVQGEAFLIAISRWLMLVITPCALGLFILAPVLLRTWMGEVNPVALAVLRIASVSVIVETFIPGAIQLFWGAGETGPALYVNLVTALVDIVLALLLLPRVGAAGAAWATFGATLVATTFLFVLAARKRHVRVGTVLRGSSRRLLPALLIALFPAYLLGRRIAAGSWPIVLAIVALSAALYLGMLWLYAASAEEKEFLRNIFRVRKSQTASSLTKGTAGGN